MTLVSQRDTVYSQLTKRNMKDLQERNIEIKVKNYPSNTILQFHEIVDGEPDYENRGTLN